MIRFATALALLLSIACGPPASEGPDLVLTGGRIYPTADGREIYGAVAIDGDRVVAIGGDPDVLALAGDDTQEMVLDAATVLPGLTDAWVDIEQQGRWEEGLDLSEVATPREVQVRLRTLLAGGAPDAIVGWGWDETRWPRRELPGAAALDEVVSDRPVVLYRRTGRHAWVNSAAAALIGTAGGVIGDPGLSRLEHSLTPPSRQQRREWLAAGLRRVAAGGVTTVATAPIDATGIELLAELAGRDEIPVRTTVRLDASDPAPDGALTDSALLTVRGVGLVLDGPFGSRDAALAEAYADGDTNGRMDGGALDAACSLAAERGLPLDVMAHGDAAVAAAVGCPALANGGLIVGADLVPAGGIAAEIRVAAVPLRLQHDMYWIAERLGQGRLARFHRYRELATAGNLSALASAAPAYPLGAMEGLRFLYTRRDRDGYPIDGWQPGQRLAVADGLRLALRPVDGGPPASLGEGGVADLVVWSHDPFDDSEVSLARALPMVTIVAGRVTYSRPLVTPDFSTDR